MHSFTTDTLPPLSCSPIPLSLPLPSPSSSSGEGALYVIHVALSNNSEEVLLSALSDPNAGLPHVRKSDNARRMYMSALLKEKAKRTPRAILVSRLGSGLSPPKQLAWLTLLLPVEVTIDTNSEYIRISIAN